MDHTHPMYNMPVLPDSLLGEHHHRILTNALAVAANLQTHIDTAKRAGIDVSEHEARLHEHRAKLAQIKQVYFPGR